MSKSILSPKSKEPSDALWFLAQQMARWIIWRPLSIPIVADGLPCATPHHYFNSLAKYHIPMVVDKLLQPPSFP